MFVDPFSEYIGPPFVFIVECGVLHANTKLGRKKCKIINHDFIGNYWHNVIQTHSSVHVGLTVFCGIFLKLRRNVRNIL
jgi:hypothetical protein